MKEQNKEKNRTKNKMNGRRTRAYLLLAPLAGKWVSRRVGFRSVSAEAEIPAGPAVIIFNHCCAYDPIMIGAAFCKKPLSFIASEHILRMRPWGSLLARYTDIIPHRKGAMGNRTALTAIKRVRHGSSVFLAAEGEQTWDGISAGVMPFTGKLVKSSGATLITYLLEGAFLAKPRWASNDRSGEVNGRIVNVYDPKTLAGMSEAEIEAAVARDISFDVWDWQRSKPGGPTSYRPRKGGTADGIERDVFSCPECGRIGGLSSSGTFVSCSCGFKIRMLDTGFFEENDAIETITDWEKLDKSRLWEIMENSPAGEELFRDDGASLIRITDDHGEEELTTGRIALSRGETGFELSVGSRTFALEEIKSMTMILARRIVFSDKSDYYEIRSPKNSRVNLRKYVIARETAQKLITRETAKDN